MNVYLRTVTMALAAILFFLFSCQEVTAKSSSWSQSTTPTYENSRFTRDLTPAERQGREIWFKSTFGGEKFFSLILPNPPFNLVIGFDKLLTSNRDTRFRDYGVLNDPDCRPGDASTGFFDRCRDPNSSGVVGIRKFSSAKGDTLIGVTCAACHAGLDPTHPPRNPNHLSWTNIHPTIGNQYLNVGKLFSAHLSPHDPRYQVFQTWNPGTVDTTAIENDHINNPGIITQFFNFPDRPFFELTQNGLPIRVHRSGQGGEDDTGCENAALRVFFNIGMCAKECMVGHLNNGPGGTQTPIDKDQCRTACPEFVQAERSVGDMCAFMQTTQPPRLVKAPRGSNFIDHRVLKTGKQVFEAECAGCHSNGQPHRHNVLSDDLIHLAHDIGTNPCRALTTNWQAGHIWEAFSSDQYKTRPTGGLGFYRDVPLLGIWATAPFLHNNRLGSYSGDFTVKGRIAAYNNAFDLLLNPKKRSPLVLKATDSVVVGPNTLPVGTPVGLFANANPFNPKESLCSDWDETKGHTYGEQLSPYDKNALKEYLKTQ